MHAASRAVPRCCLRPRSNKINSVGPRKHRRCSSVGVLFDSVTEADSGFLPQADASIGRATFFRAFRSEKGIDIHFFNYVEILHEP